MVLITWLFSSEGRLRAECCYSQCARRACDALQKAWRQPARHRHRQGLPVTFNRRFVTKLKFPGPMFLF